MNRFVLPVVATLIALPAFAQSTITLDEFKLDKQTSAKSSQSGAANEMENCLLDQTGCKNSEFKSSARFSLDDVVNLGVIDREVVKTKSVSGRKKTAAPLPSIDLEILFDYDSADLRQDQFLKLGQLAEILKGEKFGTFRLLFLGHSDAKGDPAYNRTLSERRAQAVANFVRSVSKIAADRVFAGGLGASKLKDIDDPFGAQNRRVQLVLVPAE